MRASGAPKTALRTATCRSQAEAMATPPATQMPLIAAIVVLPQFLIVSNGILSSYAYSANGFGVVHPGQHFVQITAGGERPPGAGDHDDVDVRVGVGEAERVLDLAVELRRERVQGVRAIQADAGDRIADLVVELFEGSG